MARRWGPRALFVLDRGVAGRSSLPSFLHAALTASVRLVVRWPKRDRLVQRGQPAKQATTAWRLTAGQRAWGTCGRWDPRRRCWLQTSLVALPVRRSAGPPVRRPAGPMDRSPTLRSGWSSPGGGTSASVRDLRPSGWATSPGASLLTTEPVQTREDAQRIVQASARRWQVACAFRFGKSALGVASIRVRGWQRQAKLLALLSLAYSFLVWLLQTQPAERIAHLLRGGCHRTGRRQRAAASPLYRLRAALAVLLALALPPPIARRSSA